MRAGLLATIFPVLPVWLMALVFIVVLTAVNLTSVKNFGEFEFWFALLKVAAIVGFLLVGFALLFGLVPGVQSPGLTNFMGEGFAPGGFGGIATALFVVAFAFGGTEIVLTLFGYVSNHPAAIPRESLWPLNLEVNADACSSRRLQM